MPHSQLSFDQVVKGYVSTVPVLTRFLPLARLTHTPCPTRPWRSTESVSVMRSLALTRPRNPTRLEWWSARQRGVGAKHAQADSLKADTSQSLHAGAVHLGLLPHKTTRRRESCGKVGLTKRRRYLVSQFTVLLKAFGLDSLRSGTTHKTGLDPLLSWNRLSSSVVYMGPYSLFSRIIHRTVLPLQPD